MKLLSVILTSSKFNLLVRAIKSVINQKKVDFDYDIIVNVNTLNEEFYNIVLKKIPELFNLEKNNIKIIRTESNGRPGKGHNSCIKLFKEMKNYDYLSILDGDDLYYPCAFQRFSTYLKKYKNLDLLHLMLNDRVHFQNEDDYTYKDLVLNYKLISGFNNCENWWKKAKMDSPFIGKLSDNKTPSRILLCSRNIFNTTYPIEYSETLRLYDDYLAFCSFYEAQLRNEINTYSCSDTNIYLYNSLNDYSVSYKFSEKDHEHENNKWLEETKKYTYVRSNNWKLHELPYAIIENPNNFNTSDKIDYCLKEVITSELESNNDRLETIKKLNLNDEKSVEKVEFALLYLVKSGLNDEKNIMNLLKFYINQKKIFNVLYYLDMLENFPTLQNYEFIFNVLYNNNLYDRLQKYINILKRYDSYELSEDIKNKIKIVENKKRLKNNIFLYGNNEVKIKLDKNKKLLVYYTGYSGEYNGQNYGEKNVYGSEIAAIKLCEKLADKYNVIIFCETENNIYHNNVLYIHYNYYKTFTSIYNIDYFIISRFITVYLDLNLKIVDNIYYILHDSRPHNQYYNITIQNFGLPLYSNFYKDIKNHFLVSEWQLENLKNIFNRFLNNKIDYDNFKIIGNGIDTNLNNQNFSNKDPYKFIYSSNPNRGLLPLCEIVVQLQKKYPKITLDIYFKSIEDNRINEYINKYNFIKFHGKIKNTELLKKLSNSTFWVYPNIYSHETFCIACLEAMNNKNVVITRDFSALPELVNNKDLLIPKSLEKINEVVDYCVKKIDNLMNNDKEIHKIQDYLYNRSLKFDWNNVAEKIKNILV